MAEKRFVKIYKQNDGVGEGTELLVDTVTGVTYMYHYNGYSGGLTPLLDVYGDVITTREIPSRTETAE